MVTSMQLHVTGPADLLPTRAHPTDAGLDLRSAVDVVLSPGAITTVPCGIAIALEKGTAGFVHPRSGLAARHGVTVVNAPGTIDAGYRGEVAVILTVLGPDPVEIARGDRIAQLIVQRVELPDVVAVETLPGAGDDRGVGGFGSTGN